MSKVIVVTDSTANLPEDLARQLHIPIVPLLLTFQGQTYRDGVDITSGEVYRWLRGPRLEHMPTTSAPSVGDFLRVYAAAGQEASSIVSIHPSSQLSATYEVALTASHVAKDLPIHVINSHTGAMAHGFAVLEAAHAAACGANPDEVAARATEVASKARVFFTIDTLKYLHRGGRIGGAAALLGAMLQLKPILHIVDGHVDAFARPRTKARALELILQQTAESVDSRPLHAAVLHADVPEEAEDLRQRVAERFNCAELLVTELTPAMGVHTGPGILGVAFYAE